MRFATRPIVAPMYPVSASMSRRVRRDSVIGRCEGRVSSRRRAPRVRIEACVPSGWIRVSVRTCWPVEEKPVIDMGAIVGMGIGMGMGI